MLKLQLLGGFRAWVEGQAIEGFISSKAPALLAYLAVSKRPVSRDELAGLLWGDQPDEVAKTNLRQVLSNLNKLLGDHIRIARTSVEFNFAQPYEIDALILEETSTDQADFVRLRQVVGYRGDFLKGFQVKEAPEFEEWVITQREHFHLLALRLLDALATHSASQGEYLEAIQYARRILELEPWREETHRSLMLWLARSGQRSAAIKQFQDCQQILSRELGVSPSAETTALHQRLQAAVANPLSHLPAQTTPFIGRESDLQAALVRLREPTCHLLTLSGPGGIGKTRLALEVALHLSQSLINGACFVPLTNIEAPDLLVPTIASATGLTLSPNGSLEDQLLAFLKNREMLLVLDNLEQLLIEPQGRSETGGLISRILGEAPDVKLLITSRVRLNLGSESVQALDGVEEPDALSLFVESARRVEAGFILGDEVIHARRICHLVQGNPLGLELASAQVRILSPKDIADEIQRSVDFLSADRSDMPQRQLSMRAVFEHSWHLLFPAERELFQRLSVFRGGFSLGAARQVAAATPQTLATLLDKSLLRRSQNGRYELHELMRQFGEEKLDQDSQRASEARDLHRDHFAEYIDLIEQHSRTDNMQQGLEKIAADYGNLRLAWQGALDQANPEVLFKMVTGFHFFHLRSGKVREGYALFGKTVAVLREQLKADPNPRRLELLAKVLTQEASLQTMMGEFSQARQKAQEAVEIYRALNIPRQLSRTLTYVGNTSYNLGDTQAAADAWEEGLQLSRQENDLAQMAVMLGNLGHASMATGNFAEAEQRFQQALRMHRQSGETARAATLLGNLGELANAQDKPQEALPWLQEALQIHRSNGDRPKTALVLTNLSVAYDRLGKLKEHQEAVDEALSIAREINALDLLAAALSNKAYLCGTLGQASQACTFAREAVAMARQMNSTTMSLMVGVGLCSTACALALYAPAAVLGTVVLRSPGRRSSDRVSAQASYQKALSNLSPQQIAEVETRAEGLDLEAAIEMVLGALDSLE
jgi:predicted ATPase/DNA-binding SARP family transcriptional activator